MSYEFGSSIFFPAYRERMGWRTGVGNRGYGPAELIVAFTTAPVRAVALACPPAADGAGASTEATV